MLIFSKLRNDHVVFFHQTPELKSLQRTKRQFRLRPVMLNYSDNCEVWEQSDRD